MKLYTSFLFLLLYTVASSQIIGKVTDASGEPLPFVNIYIDNSSTGTTTNKDGNYELNIDALGTYTISFQFIGYTPEKKTVQVSKLPYILNATLQEETTSLDEVVLNSGENPAYRIIREAIANRKTNLAKTDEFTADFYSRGLWRIEDAPEKILGQEIGDFNGGLDSTRQGVIYLSETISEIKYKAPDNFKENIVASIVSGDDNGFSLNTAQESNISFYNNTINLNTQVISPIADYAFNYYDYKLVGVFYDDLGHLINKIEVIPKRQNDPVFSGLIYISEDTYEIYGTALNITGKAIQIPFIETLVFTQNFKYSTIDSLWLRTSQVVDFSFAFFGVKGNGRFTAVYSNYDFSPQFDSKTFGSEILTYESEANKKDSIFWKGVRPVPLTDEELTDYIKKDSIQEIRGSKTYLDSVDRAENRFKISDVLFGYHYKNSFKKYDFDISAPITNIHYNTVQGWNGSLTASFQKNQEEFNRKYWRLYTTGNYGTSDDKLRLKAGYQQKFNNTSRPILSLEAGTEIQQINSEEPIKLIVNDVASLFFERNYLRIYERQYAQIGYSQELINGLRFYGGASYERRIPLFNTTDQTFYPREGEQFTSNNPLQPLNEDSAPFVEHNIVKASLNAQLVFGQKYYSYPDGKYNTRPDKYPVLFLGYEGGYGATVSDYNFHHLKARLAQAFNIGNKGRFGYNLRTGTFLNGESISYLDFKHFNGNQTRIGTSNTYLNNFNLLPYYALSTNDTYFEGHLEHDFKGYILNKIPLVNTLGFSLVLGAHTLNTTQNKPYTEYSVGFDNVGFGKFRFFRVDYVTSNINGNKESAFIFGLKVLNLLGID